MFLLPRLALSSASRAAGARTLMMRPSLATRTFAAVAAGERPRDVGILALEVYFPSQYVSQTELEKYDGVGTGKYTTGLGQKSMAVCGDAEDIISICMTASKNLLEKYGLSARDIGRLDVGTETLLDKSKSVKTDLMRLFEAEGNFDVEGADNINACYGGTAALLNAVNWVESNGWDGRYALVVCGDIAVYEKGNARPTGGAAASAFLVGPNAPLALVPGVRSSYMQHAYDFYKPCLDSEYPVVDGQVSIQCYYRAIDSAYMGMVEKLRAKTGELAKVSDFDYYLLHSPFVRHVQKSFARLPYLDLKEDPSSVAASPLAPLLQLPYEATFGNKDFDKATLAATQQLYEERVVPGLLLSEQLGNSYTCSVYASLASLINNVGAGLTNKRVVVYSYGSGLCSTMFLLQGRETNVPVFSLANIQRQLDLNNRLQQRKEVDPATFSEILLARESSYGKPNLKPQVDPSQLFPGTYYVSEVDNLYRRTYSRA